MATQLNLHATQNNGIGATYFDMTTTASDTTLSTAVTNTTASGTEIQFTQTAGGTLIQWISGRTPAAGFTLTTATITLRAYESDMSANTGGRARIFKRDSGGVETELGGGPFNDGVEFGTAPATVSWTCNVTDTAFAEDDRILLKLYLTNVGTMGGGFTATGNYDGTLLGTEVAFLNLNETVTFKSESANAATQPKITAINQSLARAASW